MIEFDFKGINLVASAELLQKNYIDAKRNIRTRFDRELKVEIHFWRFSIIGDLQELSAVKSILQSYMLCYWNRSDVKDRKIEFTKTLCRNDSLYGLQSLSFDARQKAYKYYLHIKFHSGGGTRDEAYLDGQEVLMLDIVLNKAISLLSPDAATNC